MRDHGHAENLLIVAPVVLVVIPNAEDLARASSIVAQAGYIRHESRRTVSEAVEALLCESITMLLADYDEGTWSAILEATNLQTPRPPLILGFAFSQLRSPECDEVSRAGVYSIVGRPYRASELRQVLGFAWRSWLCDRTRALTKRSLHRTAAS